MRDGLVDKATSRTALGVFELVVVELGGHEPLAGDSDCHAGGVAGDPPPPPLLGAVGRGPRAAGGVEDQVPRISGHQDAALHDLRVGLDSEELRIAIARNARIRPYIGYRAHGDLVQKTDITERVTYHKKSFRIPQTLHSFSVCFPVILA